MQNNTKHVCTLWWEIKCTSSSKTSSSLKVQSETFDWGDRCVPLWIVNGTHVAYNLLEASCLPASRRLLRTSEAVAVSHHDGLSLTQQTSVLQLESNRHKVAAARCKEKAAAFHALAPIKSLALLNQVKLPQLSPSFSVRYYCRWLVNPTWLIKVKKASVNWIYFSHFAI